MVSNPPLPAADPLPCFPPPSSPDRYKTVREIVTLERMHQAFACGLMEYGLIAGRKMPAPLGTAAAASQMVGAGSR